MTIIQEGGHWRSIRTVDERKSAVDAAVEALNDKEKLALQKILNEWGVLGRSPLAESVADVEWEEQPLPVGEWLMNEDLVGETGHDMYPQLRADLIELFEGNYHEAILTGAIGWGKDFLATAVCMRMIYELCCLKNPQHTLGLAAGEPIHIVPISRTVVAARRVVFGGICKKLALANWFRGKYEETMEEVRFKDKGIYIVGGASQDAAALGLNVIFSIVDESNFLGEGKVTTGSASGQAEDKATMIYNALTRRVKARYKRHGVRGMVMLISSKRATADFTERRIKAAIDAKDSGVFVRDYAIWQVHPEPFKGQKWYRVAVSVKEGRCRLIENEQEEDPKGALVFKVPHDVVDEFRSDPDGATRDIAGVATDFVGRLFITRRQAIDEVFDRRKPSLFKVEEWSTGHLLAIRWPEVMTKNAAGEPRPSCCSAAIRHAHIDMSENHCATGLVVGHRAGTVEVPRRNPETGEKFMESVPVIHIDGVLRIVAPDGGDIDQGEVRSLIYRLMQEGMPIRSISMDQYCAAPNLQIFRRFGLRTEEVGMRVAKLKPMLSLRQSIYEQRLIIPFHSVLDTELKALEYDEKAAKVIHPPKGHQDLADALAGVVYYINENMKGGGALVPSPGITVPDRTARGPQWSTGGEVNWNDDDDLYTGDSMPLPRTPDQDGGGGSYPSWIIK